MCAAVNLADQHYLQIVNMVKVESGISDLLYAIQFVGVTNQTVTIQIFWCCDEVKVYSKNVLASIVCGAE